MIFHGSVNAKIEYSRGVKANFQIPVSEEVTVSDEDLAAIDRGIKDADEGRTVSIEDARELLRTWVSNYKSQKTPSPSSSKF